MPNIKAAGKRRRACEPCRCLKTRCVFDHQDLTQCTNCITFKRRCFFEKDHRYLRNPGSSQSSEPPLGRSTFSSVPGTQFQTAGPSQVRSGVGDREAFGSLFSFLFSNSSVEDAEPARPNRAPIQPDVIDLGILDLETASSAFAYFLTEMQQRLPLVVLQQNISAAQCRTATPVLFLSILVVGSGRYQSNLQTTLLDEFFKVVAHQIVYQGQKRLELVQALLVTWMWMPPPDKLEDMKLSMMAHLVASMIQDLRLKNDRRYSANVNTNLHITFGEMRVSVDESTTIDGQRTLLGSFVACAMLSLVLRRPSILPFTDSTSHGLDIIRRSSEALATDKLLVAWVELERVSIDIAEATSATPNSGVDNWKSWLARTFESRLFRWRDSIGVDITQDVTLRIEYYTIMLHANLLGVSNGRTPIAPPFTADMISPKLHITDMPALGKCIGSAQAVLDSFLYLSPVEIPAVPGIIFPRVVHALLILIVAALAMLGSSQEGSTPQNALIARDVADLAIDQYLDHMIRIFRESPGPARGRATKVAQVLALLRQWHATRFPDSATHDSRLWASTSRAESTNLTGTDGLPVSNNSHPANLIFNSPNDFQRSDALGPGLVSDSAQPFPLTEEQYAFFESLVESPGRPPWSLFEDVMAVFDFM